jgi:hypothetical protein
MAQNTMDDEVGMEGKRILEDIDACLGNIYCYMLKDPEIMFSHISLYREVMTHREIEGTTDNDKLHQRQQVTRIKTTLTAGRTIYTLAAAHQKSWCQSYKHNSRFPSVVCLYPEMHMRGVWSDL